MENTSKELEITLSNGYVYKYEFISEESRETYLSQLYNKGRFCRTTYNGEVLIINKDHIISIRVL